MPKKGEVYFSWDVGKSKRCEWCARFGAKRVEYQDKYAPKGIRTVWICPKCEDKHIRNKEQ